MVLVALLAALCVYVSLRHGSFRSKPFNARTTFIASLTTFLVAYFGLELLSRSVERFTDAATTSTADEAGLVFGTLLGGTAKDVAGKVVYSGDTLSIVNDNSMYIAKNNDTDKSKRLVKMQDTSSSDNSLAKFRIQILSQTSFDKLVPVIFTEFVTLTHTNSKGEDRFIASANGVLTYGNKNTATSTGDYKHIFKIYNANDLTDDKNILTRDSPIFVQYAGQGAGSDSWLVIDNNGFVNCTGTKDTATKLHVSDCVSNCNGPNWRFL